MWRVPSMVAGFGLALSIGLSRLELHAHSASEVVSGLLVGAVPTLVFLVRWGAHWRWHGRACWIIPIILCVIVLTHGERFPSQKWLKDAAARVNADHKAHVRQRAGT
ncbi:MULTISPECIES: hypothetical protein [unclassified Dyella]|uniref:hypothetical protein n=1 Tax=unclassified Dyella TaxID=2634549 RepID=UPI0011AF23BB|nr:MULTISPECIES: hypothetical protein [unclassified Dyella]MDR3447336.1 hypothetical protein [Dyella sp.]